MLPAPASLRELAADLFVTLNALKTEQMSCHPESGKKAG